MEIETGNLSCPKCKCKEIHRYRKTNVLTIERENGKTEEVINPSSEFFMKLCQEDESQIKSVKRKSGLIIVVFECMFSATFDENLNDEEMQEKLDEFESSGRFDEWLQKPLLS